MDNFKYNVVDYYKCLSVTRQNQMTMMKRCVLFSSGKLQTTGKKITQILCYS